MYSKLINATLLLTVFSACPLVHAQSSDGIDLRVDDRYGQNEIHSFTDIQLESVKVERHPMDSWQATESGLSAYKYDTVKANFRVTGLFSNCATPNLLQTEAIEEDSYKVHVILVRGQRGGMCDWSKTDMTFQLTFTFGMSVNVPFEKAKEREQIASSTSLGRRVHLELPADTSTPSTRFALFDLDLTDYEKPTLTLERVYRYGLGKVIEEAKSLQQQ